MFLPLGFHENVVDVGFGIGHADDSRVRAIARNLARRTISLEPAVDFLPLNRASPKSIPAGSKSIPTRISRLHADLTGKRPVSSAGANLMPSHDEIAESYV
jgi:hypothetical protein